MCNRLLGCAEARGLQALVKIRSACVTECREPWVYLQPGDSRVSLLDCFIEQAEGFIS